MIPRNETLSPRLLGISIVMRAFPNLSLLPYKSTYSPIHPSKSSMYRDADILQKMLSECYQATPDIMSDCISSIDGKDEGQDSQRLLDLQFAKTLRCIFDIPVAPFRKHAADRVVEL